MASAASQRRTVDGEGAGTIPSAAALRASSGQVQRASGVPLSAGISHARALTPATTAAGNTRGLPGRGASESPFTPFSQYRRRHLRAVSSQVPGRLAISLFPAPAGRQQDDPRPQHRPVRCRGPAGHRLQLSALSSAKA